VFVGTEATLNRTAKKLDHAQRSPKTISVVQPLIGIEESLWDWLRDSCKAKEEDDYECQICGETLRLADGDRYAEAHHVHPLGEGGKDIPANNMCVCPNHHALLDYGAIPLDSEEIERVGSEYIEYHNRQIFESEQGN
jgi:predicted restriction endonuclease